MQGGLRVVAADPVAQMAGILPSLTLADARALVPDLEVANADPPGDAQALAALADWCSRYTPWAAVASAQTGEHSLWLDVTGCTHLFGGEGALLGDAAMQLKAFGFACRAALAGTPGAAWAVAHGATFEPETDPPIHVIKPGGERRALNKLPIATLRLPSVIVAGLEKLGLVRIGDLDPLPRAPLGARFGSALLRRLDQAWGREREPISPRRPVPCYRARRAFAEPIGEQRGVAAVLEHLLDDLCGQLARDHRGARRLELALYLVDGRVVRQRIGTSRPVRDADHLERLFAQHLPGLDLGFGADVITLAAPTTEALIAAQSRLGGVQDNDRATTGASASALGFLIDRLGNRLGTGNVARLRPYASYVPERVVAAAPPLAATAGGAPISSIPSPDAAWREDRPRPVCLFLSPELVDVVAPLPDGPPALFRWRRRVHRVASAEGPERLAAEWWREAGPALGPGTLTARDYYRIEDIEGRRFWLYRDGLYRDTAMGFIATGLRRRRLNRRNPSPLCWQARAPPIPTSSRSMFRLRPAAAGQARARCRTGSCTACSHETHASKMLALCIIMAPSIHDGA